MGIGTFIFGEGFEAGAKTFTRESAEAALRAEGKEATESTIEAYLAKEAQAATQAGLKVTALETLETAAKGEAKLGEIIGQGGAATQAETVMKNLLPEAENVVPATFGPTASKAAPETVPFTPDNRRAAIIGGDKLEGGKIAANKPTDPDGLGGGSIDAEAAPATAPSGAGPIEPPAPPKSTAAAGAAGEGPIRVPKTPAEEVEITLAELDKLDLTQAKTRETLFIHKKVQAVTTVDRFKKANPGWEADQAAVDYVNRIEDNIAVFENNESAAFARAQALEKAGPAKPVAKPAPAATPAPAAAVTPPAGVATPAPAAAVTPPAGAATPAPAAPVTPPAGAATPAPATLVPDPASAVPPPPITAPLTTAGAPPPLPAAPAPKLTGWQKVGKWFEDVKNMQPGRPAGPAITKWEPGLVSTVGPEIPNPVKGGPATIKNPDGVVPAGVRIVEAWPGSQLGKYNTAGHDAKGIGHFEFLDGDKIGQVFEKMLKKSTIGKPSEFIDGGFVFDEGAKSTSLVSNFLNAAKKVHGPRRFANLGGGEINTGFVAAAADEMQRSVDKFIKQFCERQYNKCLDVGDLQGAKNAKQVLEQYIKDSTETRWKSLGFKDAVNESTLNKVKPSLLAKAEEAANASTVGKASPKAIGLAIPGHVVNAVSLGGELAAKAVKAPFALVEMLPYYIKAPAKVILSVAAVVGLGFGLKKTGEGVVDVYDAGKQKVEEVKEVAHKVGDTYDKATQALDTAHKKLDGALDSFAQPAAGTPAAGIPAAPALDKASDGKVKFAPPVEVPAAPLIIPSGGTPAPAAPEKPADGKVNKFTPQSSIEKADKPSYANREIQGGAKPTAIADARLTNASKTIELS